MRPQCGRQRGQLVAAQQRAGRVGRRGDQRADALLVPVALDQLRRQLVTHLGTDRHQLRRAFDQPQEMPVARIAGVGEQPVLAGIDQQAGSQQQRTGAAGSNQDALGVNRQSVAAGVKTGYCLTQGRQPASRGIARVSGGQRRLTGGDDRGGSGEVRLTDFQVNDVMAQSLQLIGSLQQRHDVKGFDCAAARTVRSGHLTYLSRTKRGFYPRSRERCSHRRVRE
ncbi:hypothetical protein SSTU70S_01271 [Stutzerimonas stutzeri]